MAKILIACDASFIGSTPALRLLAVDVKNVRRDIGSDDSNGHAFIYPLCGYGGSCFPKDVKVLGHMAGTAGSAPDILHVPDDRNRTEEERLFGNISECFSAGLSRPALGIWILALKPRTNDSPVAPSLVIIEPFIDHGASVISYDHVTTDSPRQLLPDHWFTSKQSSSSTVNMK